MEGSFDNREKRSHPRVVIDLPIEYRDMGGLLFTWSNCC